MKKQLTPTEMRAAHKATTSLFVTLVELSLYTPHVLTVEHVTLSAKELRLHQCKHDMFCPHCGRESTFASVQDEDDVARAAAETGGQLQALQATMAGRDPSKPYEWATRFSLRMACARAGHRADFYFASTVSLLKESMDDFAKDHAIKWIWTITKVGQTPSLTDFHRSDVSQFASAITKAQEKDFIRAINTGAHGFNVAACVYYRRVFEGILDSTAAEHASANGLAQPWKEYEGATTLDKVKLLRDDLPQFLVENSHLYTLLSKGAHRLTEEECGEQLPIIRQAIELILEERVEKLNRKKRQADTAKLLQQANAKHEGK